MNGELYFKGECNVYVWVMLYLLGTRGVATDGREEREGEGEGEE